jgi:hypothetical protein
LCIRQVEEDKVALLASSTLSREQSASTSSNSASLYTLSTPSHPLARSLTFPPRTRLPIKVASLQHRTHHPRRPVVLQDTPRSSTRSIKSSRSFLGRCREFGVHLPVVPLFDFATGVKLVQSAGRPSEGCYALLSDRQRLTCLILSLLASFLPLLPCPPPHFAFATQKSVSLPITDVLRSLNTG